MVGYGFGFILVQPNHLFVLRLKRQYLPENVKKEFPQEGAEPREDLKYWHRARLGRLAPTTCRMNKDLLILNELKAMHQKVDLLVESLPPEKQAEFKNNLLENEFQKTMSMAHQGDPKPLRLFLKTRPTYLKTRR